MSVTALVGCQWGDEGKGKIVDILSAGADAVARYQGGANAGHTVVIGDDKHVLHLLPVGILREGVRCLLGNGMVIEPGALLEEIDAVESAGRRIGDRLSISPSAHLILPIHKAVERHRESAWSTRIGTTLRGIGPAYETKCARIGLRMGDLFDAARTRERVEAIRRWALESGCPDAEVPPLDETIAEVTRRFERIGPHVRELRAVTREILDGGGELLLEGAQGVLLDLDHGSYPFVTSSSTSSGGAALGIGLAPTRLDRVVGVAKAYTTRVGEGPFPTEFDEGPRTDAFRERAGEFGATTGRPRRCGWLDGELLRLACEVNGVTALVITKLDVLDGEETIRIATGYESVAGGVDGWIGMLERAVPVYEEHPGWHASTAGVTEWDALPEAARRYVARIEEIAGVPVAMVSTGVRRDEFVVRHPSLLTARGTLVSGAKAHR